MDKFTVSVSRSASVTSFDNKIVIRSDSSNYRLPGEFYGALIIIIMTIALFCYYDGYDNTLTVILVSIFLLLIFISISTQLIFLMRYTNYNEELEINTKQICYKRRNHVVLRRNFADCSLSFNIENDKILEIDYDKQRNYFNPMFCILEGEKKHYIMKTLTIEECNNILDIVEEWYEENNVIDCLKIYRKSIKEITLYKDRYWKCKVLTKLCGGIR